MTARRILSVWLPRLAIERWAKVSGCAPDPRVVLTVDTAHGPVIHAVTQAAAERGALAGARLTDARALDPGLVAIPADRAGDDALVRRLAHWATRWSPLVEVDGGDGLRLDVTGVAHLFGGEAGLIADVEQRFAALGLTVRMAVAPTAGAAWALARFTPSPLCGGGVARSAGERGCMRTPPLPGAAAGRRSLPRGGGREDLATLLAPLPVAALRLSPQATRTLERLGLKTIGMLSGIERRSLARRFRDADNLIDALDRMLGRKADPLTATPFEPPPRALLRLKEPVTHAEAASQALELLVPRLVRELEARKLGARTLALVGFRVDGGTEVASVSTSIPSREPGHLQRLLAEKAAALDPGFGFDGFALEASWCEQLGAAQQSLIDEADGEADVARLVDRLSVKLGAGCVRRPCAQESHLPERASGWVSAVRSSLRAQLVGRRTARRSRVVEGFGAGPSTMQSSLHGPPPQPRIESGAREELDRPQRLLDRPEAIGVVYATPEGVPRRFTWRRAVHDIARVEGPERIAPEWWRQPSSTRLRDYYRVEDAAGRRYWIYREGVTGDGRGGAPGWFIHGLFG